MGNACVQAPCLYPGQGTVLEDLQTRNRSRGSGFSLSARASTEELPARTIKEEAEKEKKEDLSPPRRVKSEEGSEHLIAEYLDDVRLERTRQYVGSYGKLKGFFRRCLDIEIISQANFSDLVACLEDISEHGREKERLRHLTVMPNFKGSSEEEVVGGMGLMELAPPRPELLRRLSLNEGSFVVEESGHGVNEISDLLHNPSFNCRSRGLSLQADVQAVTYGFTSPYNLVGRYKINIASLDNWVGTIAKAYQDNPYHNWMHAFDVFQLLHLSLGHGAAGEYFNFQDILAILCGGIAHDVGHAGTNNAFLVNTGARLAITYNDRSPLENMHASVCFEILHAPGNNFLSGMKEESFKTFRAKVIENILATDMSHHFDLVDKFNARVEHQKDTPFVKGSRDDRDKQLETKEDRRLLMQAFTHMADLGHCTRPWDVHKVLVVALEEEFFSQGDKEREAGIPISPMMDRSKDSAATGQTFFLDKLVRPLLDPYCAFVHPDLSSIFSTNLNNNRDKWAELVRLHGKLPACDLLPLEAKSPCVAQEDSSDMTSALQQKQQPQPALQ